jgi:hypothetical protein
MPHVKLTAFSGLQKPHRVTGATMTLSKTGLDIPSLGSYFLSFLLPKQTIVLLLFLLPF